MIGKCDNCINGICRDDGSCSCDIKYNSLIKSSIIDNTKFCDNISSCKIHDPFCIKCINTSCLECEKGFILNPNKNCGNNI